MPAVFATMFRMFGNPASTVENLFYFGFLTERVSKQLNRYVVPFLIGAMYTLHEMTIPSTGMRTYPSRSFSSGLHYLLPFTCGAKT
jgi:hypothetical protein